MEKIRNNARMIKLALNNHAPRRGLTHVTGPHPSDPARRLESKTRPDLETMCLSEAGRRFTQAATTPFLTPPLLEIFTESNLATHAFDQVLEGTFECPKEVNDMTKRLLAALKRPPTIPCI